MKDLYRKGEIKDVEVKERLFEVMNEYLKPIRERRVEAEGMKDELLAKALDGSKKVQVIAKDIVEQMKEAMELGFDNR